MQPEQEDVTSGNVIAAGPETNKLQQQVGLPLQQAVQITNLSESPTIKPCLTITASLSRPLHLESARFQATRVPIRR